MIEKEYNLIKNLEEKRKSHYLSLKENKDKSHEIIGEQLYSKQSHFLFELIQNAEDEGATKINIIVSDESLVFEHNGNPFSIKDVEAITTFGNNERKKLKANAIGRFGIGFKSVFNITQNPEIHSGHFHFKIKHYIIPEIIEYEFLKTTRITLPFKKSGRIKIIQGVTNALNHLDHSYILFLNNIKRITWKTSTEQGELIVKSRKFRKSQLKTIEILSNGVSEKFLSITSTYKVGKKILPIKIASKISKTKSAIKFEAIKDSPLFAFFPTEKYTSLPFLIHAPFLTTAARDNITDDSRNDRLVRALSQLFIKKVEQLKSLNLININTWKIFPCNPGHQNDEIYNRFYGSLLSYLKKRNSEIIPTQGKELSHIKNIMFITHASIPGLLNTRELSKLFGRKKWLFKKTITPNISHVKNFFIDELNIPSYGMVDFCGSASNTFFKNKTDQWLLKFYGIISDSSTLWKTDRYSNDGPLRYKKFIRTENNTMIAPFHENGTHNVYLPIENNSEYPYVKNLFIENKSSKKLFTAIGLKKPNIVSEAIEFAIPRITKNQKIYGKYKNDLDVILQALKKSDSDEEEQIIEALKEKPWLPAKDPIDGKIILSKADEIYYPSKNLKSFLRKIKTVSFLATNYLKNGKSHNRFKDQFQQLGLFFVPRRYYINEDDLIFENNDSRNNSKEDYWNDNGDNLEGLKEFITKNIKKRKSILLWNILIECRQEWGAIKYRDTEFIQLLKKKRWLYDKYNIKRKPDEITVSELDEAYTIDDEAGTSLYDVLEFAKDEIKEFEEIHGVKAIPIDELEKLNRKIEDLEEENKRLKAKYEPSPEEDIDKTIDHLPDIEDVEIDGAILNEVIDGYEEPLPLDHQGTDGFIGSGFKSFQPSHNGEPTSRQKNTGHRGEEYILKLLNDKYKDDKRVTIKELNKDDKFGIGCDIIIEKDSEAYILIEVKATEGGYDNTFSLSKKQWATAIRSHINNDLVPYHVYCVYYARSTTPKHILIENPVDWMLNSKMKVLDLPFWVKIREKVEYRSK